MEAENGMRLAVEEDDTGIVIKNAGTASQPNAIEVANLVHVKGGVRVQVFKDGSPLITKHGVAYGQKATFILHPKLYWGIASEIEEGDAIGSAVMFSDDYWKLDIESLEKVVVVLKGNAKEGYRFSVESMS